MLFRSGGGYYGTMAALTFLFIEATDEWSFLVGVFSPHTVMLEVIPSLLVQLVINSFMNLLGALLWFVTLPNQVDMNEGWIWLVASYLGYLAGLRLAAIAGDKIQAQVKKSFARLRKA